MRSSSSSRASSGGRVYGVVVFQCGNVRGKILLDQRASYGGFLSPPMTQIFGPRRGREKVNLTLSPANLVVVVVCETSGDAYGSLAAAEIIVDGRTVTMSSESRVL